VQVNLAALLNRGRGMRIDFIHNSGMPKLAWSAKVEPQKQTISATIGDWVEILNNGFLEGVADDNFSSSSFDRTACIFGSGAIIRGEEITFVSSAATTDYLYWTVIDDGRVVHISNSLPLLLACLNDQLDKHCLNYSEINNSIALGINNYRKSIPTNKGAVNRLMYRNLRVSAEGIAEIDKPLAPRFASFAEYFNYLSSSYERLAKNARDINRKRPMAIFSTQSRGYDSSAINAIAKDHDIDLVFTVSKGKARGLLATQDQNLEVNDDGTQICEKFGLPCMQIERRALENDSEHEALFYAAIDDNGDFNLQQIGTHVTQPTILLTGSLGEIWYTASYSADKPGTINGDLVRGDLGTHGLTEVRLEAGYIQLPLSYVGATSREDILRITESLEMNPWRLGTDYDRPIPRRIAENAGLGREMFGQVKMASVLEYPAPRLPLNLALRSAYFDFLVENRLISRWQIFMFILVRKWNTVIGTTSPKYYRWNYYLQRVISRIARRPFAFPLLWQHLNGSIFCFCVNQRVLELRQRLNLQ